MAIIKSRFWHILQREIVERKTLSQRNILTILHNAQIVSVGQPIWETAEEYERYEKIVKATVKWMEK
jgi:hypothetical protein